MTACADRESAVRIRPAGVDDVAGLTELAGVVATLPLLLRYGARAERLVQDLVRLACAQSDLAGTIDPSRGTAHVAGASTALPQGSELLLVAEGLLDTDGDADGDIGGDVAGDTGEDVDADADGDRRSALLGFARVQLGSDPSSGHFGRGGYLRLIALRPQLHGRGVGSHLLGAVEAAVQRRHPDLFLLTSDFNVGAQRFYERAGYCRVGALPDFVHAGITELIYWKRLLAPIAPSQSRPS